MFSKITLPSAHENLSIAFSHETTDDKFDCFLYEVDNAIVHLKLLLTNAFELVQRNENYTRKLSYKPTSKGAIDNIPVLSRRWNTTVDGIINTKYFSLNVSHYIPSVILTIR